MKLSIKFKDCYECEHQDNDDICDLCEDGEMFEEMLPELDFNKLIRERAA